MLGYIKVGKNATVTVWLIFSTKNAHKRRSYAGLWHYATFPEKVTSGGLDKKEISVSTSISPTVIHSHSRPIPRPYSSHSPPVQHLPSTITFATILHPPCPPSPLSSHRATPSSKPHTCAVFHALATHQYRAILRQKCHFIAAKCFIFAQFHSKASNYRSILSNFTTHPPKHPHFSN